jgi:N-acetylmuramic acid 6-phosphate etherase
VTATSVPLTEAINKRTQNLDLRSVRDQVRLMNAEDHRVPEAVKAVAPRIATAVARIAQAIRGGGRLIYVGAGTSGRLAVLDAAECPPTFGTAPELIQAVLAGGSRATAGAVEDAEDDEAAGAREMDARTVGAHDVVVGVAAGGATPFVLGAVRRARARGATTVALACTPESPLEDACHLGIVPLVGPEVIAGSTRLKAGTAQKLVLNMLSTLTMVQLGKVYGNLMVDLRASNEKLRRRAVRIVAAAAGVAEPEAVQALDTAGGSVPVAVVMLGAHLGPEAAKERLSLVGGNVRRALAAAP